LSAVSFQNLVLRFYPSVSFSPILGILFGSVHQVPKTSKGSKYRCVWGRIRRTHGGNGIVRASFAKNLPPKAMGATLRVMLYPSAI
jgi:large subunit ribosomal protein L35Ae